MDSQEKYCVVVLKQQFGIKKPRPWPR